LDALLATRFGSLNGYAVWIVTATYLAGLTYSSTGGRHNESGQSYIRCSLLRGRGIGYLGKYDYIGVSTASLYCVHLMGKSAWADGGAGASASHGRGEECGQVSDELCVSKKESKEPTPCKCKNFSDLDKAIKNRMYASLKKF